MRADAIANRERLLDTAEVHFARYGLDASMHGIADAAGVGVGTLYRNFASHSELIGALFDRIRLRFRAIADKAESQPTGWGALETFLRESVAFLVDNPATAEIMRRQSEIDPAAGPTPAWVEPLSAFVERAQTEGDARDDLTGADLSAAPLALGAMQNFNPNDRHRIAARMMTLMLDGMRAHPHEATPLPENAQSVRQPVS